VNAGWVVEIVAGDPYAGAAEAIPVVAVTICVLAVTGHTLVAALTAEVGGRPIAFIKIATLITVWPATLIGIQHFGVAGLAGGFAAAYVVEAIALMITATAVFSRRPQIRIPLACAILLLLVYAAPDTTGNTGWDEVAIRAAVSVSTLVATAWFLDRRYVLRVWELVGPPVRRGLGRARRRQAPRQSV
jgi:hypothetical protein